jgi:prepilin-type N-terminal cleavage/methylation domain-containing protein
MENDQKQTAAFTILEMVVCVIVMGIIASIAYPRYLVSVEQFRAKEGDQILLSLYGAEKRYALANDGNYTANFAELDVEIRPSEIFEDPALSTTINPLASITVRSDQTKFGQYTLSIYDTAAIYCSGGTSSICQKMGYAAPPP